MSRAGALLGLLFAFWILSVPAARAEDDADAKRVDAFIADAKVRLEKLASLDETELAERLGALVAAGAEDAVLSLLRTWAETGVYIELQAFGSASSSGRSRMIRAQAVLAQKVAEADLKRAELARALLGSIQRLESASGSLEGGLETLRKELGAALLRHAEAAFDQRLAPVAQRLQGDLDSVAYERLSDTVDQVSRSTSVLRWLVFGAVAAVLFLVGVMWFQRKGMSGESFLRELESLRANLTELFSRSDPAGVSLLEARLSKRFQAHEQELDSARAAMDRVARQLAASGLEMRGEDATARAEQAALRAEFATLMDRVERVSVAVMDEALIGDGWSAEPFERDALLGAWARVVGAGRVVEPGGALVPALRELSAAISREFERSQKDRALRAHLAEALGAAFLRIRDHVERRGGNATLGAAVDGLQGAIERVARGTIHGR